MAVVGTFDNSKELYALEKMQVSCGTFTGNGKISAPEIVIKTNIFAYTGVISCTESCTIIAGAPFDASIFKFEGPGELSIIIDENVNAPDPEVSKAFEQTIQDAKNLIKDILHLSVE